MTRIKKPTKAQLALRLERKLKSISYEYREANRRVKFHQKYLDRARAKVIKNFPVGKPVNRVLCSFREEVIANEANLIRSKYWDRVKRTIAEHDAVVSLVSVLKATGRDKEAAKYHTIRRIPVVCVLDEQPREED